MAKTPKYMREAEYFLRGVRDRESYQGFRAMVRKQYLRGDIGYVACQEGDNWRTCLFLDDTLVETYRRPYSPKLTRFDHIDEMF